MKKTMSKKKSGDAVGGEESEGDSEDESPDELDKSTAGAGVNH